MFFVFFFLLSIIIIICGILLYSILFHRFISFQIQIFGNVPRAHKHIQHPFVVHYNNSQLAWYDIGLIHINKNTDVNGSVYNFKNQV